MKKQIPCCLLALAAAAAIVSCKDSEAYETSVTRDIQCTLDGEPWAPSAYRPDYRYLFIYNSDGSFFANYSQSYKFALPDGDYRCFISPQSDLITPNPVEPIETLMQPPTPLDEIVIPQDPETKQVFQVSDVLNYRAGDPMSFAIKTRTGTLRLRALDEKPDKSYSTLRATVTTPVTGYHVATASVVTGEPMELVREKETTGGGLGYTEDFIILTDEQQKVKVRIDYLDANGNVVNSKDFADEITVLPALVNEYSFNLNDPNEQVIVNYRLTLGSSTWENGNIFPQIPVDVPEGFDYIEPGMDLAATFKEQADDESKDEIRLFLKANTRYTLASSALTISKPVHIMGQTPGFGQTPASVTVSSLKVGGDLDHIIFENVQLTSADRFFNNDATPFTVNEIAFVGCTFSTWRGTLWYQNPRADGIQTIGTMRVENCYFNNYSTSGSNPLIGGCARYTSDISSIVLRNNRIIGTNFGTSLKNPALIGNISTITVPLTVTIEGNTIIDTRSAGSVTTFFILDGAAAPSTDIIVRNNKVSGVVSDKANWFSLGKYTSLTVEGNTRTAGYTLLDWGVDAPEETGVTYDELLNQSRS